MRKFHCLLQALLFYCLTVSAQSRYLTGKIGENGNNPGVSTKAEELSNYVPVPFGIASGYLSQNTSYIGPSQIVKGQFNRNMVLMTAAESFFLLAEAKQRYGAGVTLPLTAQAYYEQGVKESFRLTGTAAAAATTLLTSGKDLADWTASPDKLKAIWMQKWISLVNYGGLEAWSEFRRTNFPVTPPSASAAANQKLPLRPDRINQQWRECYRSRHNRCFQYTHLLGCRLVLSS